MEEISNIGREQNSSQKTRIVRVNIDFPEWVVDALDRESSRLGIARQALVRVWIAEKIDRESKNNQK